MGRPGIGPKQLEMIDAIVTDAAAMSDREAAQKWVDLIQEDLRADRMSGSAKWLRIAWQRILDAE